MFIDQNGNYAGKMSTMTTRTHIQWLAAYFVQLPKKTKKDNRKI